jgi:endonuclease YncB( thermonuclease family)
MKISAIRTVTGMGLPAFLVLCAIWLDPADIRAQEATPPPAIPVEPVEASVLEPLPPRHFSGAAVVIDAVTLQIEGETLRLYGLRGFTGDWRADAVARVGLELLLADAPLDCYAAGHDRYRRALVSCSTGWGDLVEAVLLAGLGFVDRQTTHRANADLARAELYDAAERAARERSAGLWATVPGFEPPPAPPPEPGMLDWFERFQAGIAVLIGLFGVAAALLLSGRRRRVATGN